MRFVGSAPIVAFTALALLFEFQNLESATISLFSASITLSLLLLGAGVHVLGMLTGGRPLSLRSSCVGSAWSTR